MASACPWLHAFAYLRGGVLTEGGGPNKKFYTFLDGKAELHSALVKRDEHYVFKMVRTIQVSYGKVTKDGKKKNRDKAPIKGVPFKKQSIFYK